MGSCSGDYCFGQAGKDGLCDEHRELLALRALRDAVGQFLANDVTDSYLNMIYQKAKEARDGE